MNDYICTWCGASMNKSGSTLTCPSCGYEEDVDDYDDAEEFDTYDDDIPEGCAACGGPYPDCMSSCKLFDD